MFKVKQLAWTMGCVAILGGCASWYQDNKLALDIKPVMSMKQPGRSHESMYRLGRYYQGMGRYQHAIAAYEKALKVAPDYVEAYNELGVIHSLQGRHELALQHFKKAINQAPMATYLHNNLGYAYLIQGQESEAAESFRQALRIDPENQRARRNLATAYERAGLHDEADMLTMVTSRTATASTAKPARMTVAMPEKMQIPNNSAAGEHKPDERLVQVAPNVYEYRVAKREREITVFTEQIITKPATLDTVSLTSQNVQIEVSNGNGITGMARHVAGYLQQRGFVNKPRLTNHETFQQAQTEIHFRRGNEVHADQISQILPKKVRIIENGSLRPDIHVQILLGKDFYSEVAYFRDSDTAQIVRNGRDVMVQ